MGGRGSLIRVGKRRLVREVRSNRRAPVAETAEEVHAVDARWVTTVLAARAQMKNLAVPPLLFTAGVAAAAAALFYWIHRGDRKRRAEDGVGVSPSPRAVSEDSMSASEEVKKKKNELNSEKSNLERKVSEIEKLLSEAQKECDIKTEAYQQEREAHSILMSRYEQLRQALHHVDQVLHECEQESKDHIVLEEHFHQMQDTLAHKEDLLQNLQISLNEAERKYEQAIESNAEMKNEVCKLELDMELLQHLAQEKKDNLNKIIMEFIHKNDQYKMLRLQHKRTLVTLKKHKLLLKNVQVAQAQTELRCGMLMETNAELRRENSDLISDSNVLQDHVHELEQKLMEIQHKNVNLTEDCKQAEKDYGVLHTFYEEALNQVNQEEKYEVLLSQVATLQDSVQKLEAALQEACTEIKEIRKYESYRLEDEEGSFPFAFYDVMGAEAEEKAGVNTQDIISALKGHMKEGYKFNSNAPLSENDSCYNRNPSLGDQMHCLVNVIAADKISLMNDEFIKKWKTIRETASSMGIPQVVFMTRPDCECKITMENSQNIYKSKKIRDKIIQCSNLLGVPVNLVFPVVNYNKETNVNTDINCLMLDALRNIVPWANDYVKKRSNKQNSHQQSN
ncbi:interferon-induced protein 44 [Silurus asotus]|uniref:Interferon-induced protein 44 n=1 Tax=Silurus asotus TaxID=30991 RepID=A0AAD5FUS6_SILAS|nr:interferon-induced protein 44 [Silurus asotus]